MLQRIKKSAKHWWDEQLNSVKEISLEKHKTWAEAGKSRSGPIFNARNVARYNYRWLINKKAS